MAEYIEREAIRGIPAKFKAGEFRTVPVMYVEFITFDSESAEIAKYCSNCGMGFGSKTHFCPMCGAKMDGERKCDDD